MDIKELYQLYRQHPCITTDSRDCPLGSIFVSLKGETFNGNRFAVQALKKGCAYAIVDEDVDTDLTDGTDPGRIIRVDDCLQTFKELAREHRRQFHIPVIAITGTNGKTTTKELLAAVLSTKYNVLYTQGNFNNDVGVPKTLFRLNAAHDVAIIEMGASHPGDIRTLAETAEPTSGIITNVGRAHLQGFGSFQGVRNTKGELYDYLSKQQEDGLENGFVYVNTDDETLMEMMDERGIIIASGYGTSLHPDTVIRGSVVDSNPYLRFSWQLVDEDEEGESYTVGTRLVGAYNIYNLLAAVSVGIHFDVPVDDINRALADYAPTNSRSQLVETACNRLVVDAYNANPSSMAASLSNFSALQAERKMAILGDMRELGDASAAEHQKIVELLDGCDFQKVWLVGPEFAKTASPYRHFPDADAVRTAIADEQPKGYTILIKGSNGVGLAKLAESL